MHLWYVGYGSNLKRARLMTYLMGGSEGDSAHHHPGARDSMSPSGEKVVQIDGRLWFGGESQKWDGGVAHLDVDGTGNVIGRAWRIGLEQLADLVAQEMGLMPGSVELGSDVLGSGEIIAKGSRQARLISLAPIEEEPAVTFTFVDRRQQRPPSPGYLATMVVGLRECGLADDQLAAYLSDQPTITEDLVAAAVGLAGAPSAATRGENPKSITLRNLQG